MSFAIAGAVLAGVIAGSALAQGADEEFAGPGADALSDPLIQDQLALEKQRELEAEAERQTPEAIADRQRSRTAYQDLSAAEAEQLALQQFPDLMTERTWRPLELADGVEVDRYFGTHAALIEPPDAEIGPDEASSSADDVGNDQGGLVESVLPLRARTEQGELRPLDPTLIERGDHVEAANPVAEAQLPDELSDGIELAEPDLSVAPAGAAEAAPAELVGPDKIFYANSDLDTDFFVTPTPLGVETFLQLRSERSPTEHSLRFELPAGAELEPDFGGLGAKIVDGQRILAVVTPPLAFDADGQSVPVELHVAAAELRISVDHRAGDWRYPILVDPEIRDWYAFDTGTPGTPPNDLTGWDWWTWWPNKFFQGYDRAIATQSAAGFQYAANEFAQWDWQAPPNTFIERVDFYNTDYGVWPNDNICTVQGLYKDNQWETGTVYVAPPGIWGSTPHGSCVGWAHTTFNHWIGSLPYLSPGDPEGSDNNVAIFQLFAYDTDYRAHEASHLIRGALFYMYDRNDPRLTSTKPANRDWHDDRLSNGTDPVYEHTLSAHDDGLGVKYFDLWRPLDPTEDPDAHVQDRRTHDCSGDRTFRCPHDHSVSYSYRLPEGLNELFGRVFDFNWRYTLEDYRWTQAIDRSAPELRLGGPLFEQQNPTSFGLTAEAIDGTATNRNTYLERAKARSGVKSIEIRVDGEQAFFDERTRAQCNSGAAWGSCAMERSFTLDPAVYGSGRHEITVIATDFVGHETVRIFERTIDAGPPSIVRVESSHAKRKLSPTQLESRWVDQEQVETMLFATDSGSGVKRFELRLPDNQTIGADGGCATDPSGGCPEYTGGTHGYATTSFPEGQVQANAVAFDNGERISPAVAVPFKVDHTNPVLDGARFNSSPLYQNRNNLVRGQSYTLDIAATDQHPSRSTAGVRSIEVLVEDGDGTSTVLKRRGFWDQPCVADSCPMERTFVFDTTHYQETDQPLTLEVRITDAAGNQFIRAPFEVRISGPALPDPEHRLLGLEQFFSYDSTETGLSGAHVNLATGNLVWHATPLINPGRGLSSVLNLTYNSFDYPEADVPAPIDSRLLDLEYDEAGPGFSLGLSGITRLNEPLRFLDFNLQNIPDGIAGRVVMTDPDGTAHTFKLRALRDPTDSDALFEYDAPPGVNLHLRRYSDLTGIENGTVLPQDVEKAWAITRPDGITYFFDGLGFLRSIEDRNLRNVGGQRVGNRLVYEYENRTLEDDDLEQLPDLPCTTVAPALCEPRLARVIDPAGADGSAPAAERSIEINYHPVVGAPAGGAGRISQIADHGGRVLRFDYDAAGQLAKLTEAGIPGSTAPTHVERDFDFRYAVPQGTAGVGNHIQLERVIDPRGRATLFSYSDDAVADTPHRRAQQVTSRRQAARTYAYEGDLKDSGSSTEATITDALGGTWAHELDPRDRPTTMTDALGTETELDWDTDNNVVGLTEAANFSDQAATTSFAYNGSGLLTSQTDPLGRTTHLAYTDHAGMHRSAVSTEGTAIDADGAFVSDLTQITRPAGNSWGFTIQPGTASDGSPSLTGNTTHQTDPLGFRFRTSYNANGTIANETDESDDKTAYRNYDPNGLPREVIDPEGFDLEQGESDAAGEEQRHRWLFSYDRVGNLTYATDPRGSAGHAPGGPAPPTFTTELTYDELDRLVSERIPKDSSTGSTPPAEKHILRSYVYDLNDNQTRIVDGVGETWKTEYTPMDRPDTDESPAGETTDYNYDPLDRLNRLTSPEGFVTAGSGDRAVEYRYDAIGRRTAQIDLSTDAANPSLITSYAYDRRDNVVGIADPRANAGSSAAGAIANASNPAKQRLSMVYDRADQLTADLEDPDGEQILTEYVYDQNGNRRIVLTPRGFSGGDPAAYARITDYDDRDMPIAEVDELGNTTSFTYGRDGKLLTEIRPNGNATAVAGDFTTTYTYDRNDDLVERTIPWAEGQYGPRNWKVSYERNRVGDPTTITDARGNAFANSFYDTGELKTTGRPSWWQLDWGSGRQAPDPGVRFRAQRGGTEADMMVPVGGPMLAERPGAVADDPGSPPPTANASEPVAPGDFGRVKREQLPDMLPRRGQARFTYDNELRLTKVTDSADQAREIAYDEAGRIDRKIWPFESGNPIVQDYGYDRNGNLTSFGDGTAAQWTFEYDQFDRLTVERAPGAKSSASDTIDVERTHYAYDPNDNLIEITTPRGSGYEFTYRYDPVDRLSEEQDPTGARWVYDYDAASNRISEISPRGNASGANPAAFETETVYDRANRPILITDPLGGETSIDYDANGNRTRIATPGGSTPEESHPAARLTTITYDGRDLPWATTTSRGQGDERTTVTEFDANGNLRRVVNPAGTTDRLPTHPDGSLGDASWNATVYQYDIHDQLEATFLPWSNAGNPDVNGVDQGVQNARRFRQDRDYDTRGRLRTITYPYKFAGPGDNEQQADRVCYQHYETGWISSSTDPESVQLDENCQAPSGQFARSVRYFYDQRGYQRRWEAVGEDEGREVRREFYPNGTLAHREAELNCQSPTPGDCDRRGYDYFYNPNRSLVEFADLGNDSSPDRRTLITRDKGERERVVDETWQSGRDTLYGYDIAGNVTTRRVDGDWDGSAYSGGTTTTFVYDALNRETKMTVDPPGDSTQDPQTQNRVTNSDYYPSGDLRLRDKAFSGVVEKHSYASDGRLERMTRDDTDDADPEPDKDQRYDYDQNGNRTRDERGTYLYNSRGQLVRWVRSEGADADTAVSYIVNGSGAVTQKRDQAGPETTYDYLADRLRSRTTTEGPGDEIETRYDYNDFGSITCARVVDPDDLEPGPEDCLRSTSITYRYDAFERRIGSSTEDDSNTEYRYDGLDRRDRKIKGGQPFDHAYIGTSELLSFQRDENNQTKRYDYDSRGQRQGQTIVGSTSGPQYRSYATDAQGSVEALESRSGAELADYDYDPYGELPDPDGDGNNEEHLEAVARGNPFRFQGHYYDSGIDTYDMQARTYGPDLGRFLSQDRYEAAGADLALQSDPLTQNRYVFAGGNPVSFVEFDGHCVSANCAEHDGAVGNDPVNIDNPYTGETTCSANCGGAGSADAGGSTPSGASSTAGSAGTTVNAAAGASGYTPPPPTAMPPQQQRSRAPIVDVSDPAASEYCEFLPTASGEGPGYCAPPGGASVRVRGRDLPEPQNPVTALLLPQSAGEGVLDIASLLVCKVGAAACAAFGRSAGKAFGGIKRALGIGGDEAADVATKTDDLAPSATRGSPPSPVAGGAPPPGEVLRPGGGLIGTGSTKVRQLRGGMTEAEELLHKLAVGGRDVTPPGHPGVLFELPSRGGYVGLRPYSKSGPPTIDVNIPGLSIREIKFTNGL